MELWWFLSAKWREDWSNWRCWWERKSCFISFHEQMMTTKMWINHALPGHWLGRITILLLTVQISGEPLDVENLRIYYSRYFRIFISLNWLVLSHGISISIIDMHPGSGRRFHIWPPLALALPATLSFEAPLMETTFLSHVSGHIAKPATPVPSALDILKIPQLVSDGKNVGLFCYGRHPSHKECRRRRCKFPSPCCR